jgi:hypothetical protein
MGFFSGRSNGSNSGANASRPGASGLLVQAAVKNGLKPDVARRYVGLVDKATRLTATTRPRTSAPRMQPDMLADPKNSR